jgi:hypothetical protein
MWKRPKRIPLGRTQRWRSDPATICGLIRVERPRNHFVLMFKKPADMGLVNMPAQNTDEQVDMRGLVRLGAWGAAATGALLFAIMAIQSENGLRRISGTSTAAVTEQLSTRTHDLEANNKRLIDSVRSLSSDRDRLLARVTVLERNLEDVTGSVGRNHTVVAPVPSAPIPTGPSVLTSLSAPATIAAFPSDRSDGAAERAPATSPELVATVTDFGVDIGGGPTVESLRGLWSSAKGTHGKVFDGLRPVISVRDGKTGAELRLVVGPLSNAAAAAKICASLAASGWTCRPAVFDGQRLALR